MPGAEPARPDVLVLGAGVIGLSAAVVLAETGRRVRIWAAEPPQATTSRAASAMWGSAFGEPADRIPGWAVTTREELERLAAEHPESGVHLCAGTLAARGGDRPPPRMFPGVALTPRAAPPGYRSAVSVTLPLLDMPQYLDFLRARLEHAGGELEVRRVAALAEAARAAPVVVNATGIGAAALVPDPAVTPVRGAHVVVENPGIDEFFLEEPFGPHWRGFHPHGDVVVLGGTMREDDWSLTPDPAEAEQIVSANAEIDPRLASARVVEHRVGLRPARRGGVRVEAEGLGPVRCVHCYGHGGSGVSLAWGCALEVLALIEAGPDSGGQRLI